MTTIAPLSEDARGKLANVATATLTTQLFKRGLRNTYMHGVHRLTPGAPQMVGQAFTLRFIPAREDLDNFNVLDDREHPQRKAIETVPAGQVLVIDSRKDMRGASAGDILVARLMVRGVAGLVTDGGMRDSPEIAKLDFPVYCAGGSAPASVHYHHAADLDCPIGCGDVAVFPGDVLVGDAEGVVVIPAHLADEVAAAAVEQERLERFLLREIQQGRGVFGTYPPNDETLARYEAWKAAGEPGN
jgi:regulator of RNase E activity RraA